MTWWQIILIALLGALPCLVTALLLAVVVVEGSKKGTDMGEINSQLKGLHSILNRIEKQNTPPRKGINGIDREGI